MPVQLDVGTADLLRCRFALSPLWETVAAVRTLAEPGRQVYHRPWLREVAAGHDPARTAPLALLLPRTGSTPDFLTPPPAGPHAEIEEELARVAATPLDQVESELRRSLLGPPGRDVVPPPEAAARLLADPGRTLRELTELLRGCWHSLLAPRWPRVRDLLEADIAVRSRDLARAGLRRTLTGLHPAVGWEEPGTLRIEAPHRAHRRLDGEGLLLLPSAFVWPALTVVTDPPWQPTLVYPARGVGELWHGAGPAAPRALARLLGRTRALLLAALDEPATTTRLARAHGLGPATVSAHLTALRESGLVSRRRIGRTVAYARTPLGVALLRGGEEPGTPAPPPR
ncbi:DUF5937 family protein [Streptomyces albidoflavus]|uniref:ArsR/SmtB family transcription factor n=1 Tax=Streptomyces TaxID=1883 RepID=UPI002147B643|nr:MULTISPECIES: winged helix-turn-helix domain-containing protein [Streptomyces]MCR0989358.1 winged helix-turn-helix domain-containing protein [Streptomyces albidoflavus]UYX92569.1 winged helix-turn-helix domain-containing protein [Streptomyces sp. BI87]